MESECREGRLEIQIKMVKRSRMFQGVPVLYESGINGQEKVIQSFIFSEKRYGWELKHQDGDTYVFITEK